MKQKIQCVNEKRGDSFKKIMKINISLAKLTKERKSESKLIKFAMTGKAEHYNRQSSIQ